MPFKMSYSPIAVFAYNRPEHFKKMFESLVACSGFNESLITLFVDGPKSDSDIPNVEKVRAYARSLKFPNINLIIRERNYGLKTSIWTGVRSLCETYGRVIVLEDDLIVSPLALEYFNSALKKYENDRRIWSVVGYQYFSPSLCNLNRALILPFTHCWGWATWDRAWSQFDIHEEIDPNDLRSRAFAHSFNVDGLRDFRNMCVLANQGKVNSWFIFWYYKIFSERGVSIFPPFSYISNIGMSTGGSHASALNPYYILVNPKQSQSRVISLPDHFKVDYWAIDIIRSSWDARVQKMISYLGNVKRLIFS